MPRISVALPAHNAAPTILRAVRSILNQTFTDLELIVLDDGSTDNTADLLASTDDSRLRIATRPHRGVAAAANEAARLARAPFIARMDADDFSHPTRLARQFDRLHADDVDVVGCQVRILDAIGQPVPSLSRYENWINHETRASQQISALRFVELPLVNPTILARREFFELGCHDNDFPEDYDLLLRAAAAGFRFAKVPEVLFDWTDHSARLTRTDARYALDAFMRCRRHHLLAGPLADVRTVDVWGLGTTGKRWLRWLQEQQRTVRHAYDVSPRRTGQSIHGVIVRHPDELPPSDGTPLIIAVGASEARPLILPHLAARGYVPGRDAWFVA